MTPEEMVRNAIEDRGMTIRAVSRKTGITYSRLQPSVRGRRELRADEYLILCRLLGLDPRGYIEMTEPGRSA